MDKEDFKDQMKSIFAEAKEEFMNRPVYIPHARLTFECHDCEDEVLTKTESNVFVFPECESIFHLELIKTQSKQTERK